MYVLLFKSKILIEHKQSWEQHGIRALKTSKESHLYWEKYFHKNPVFRRIYADFEVDNEVDASFANSSLCDYSSSICTKRFNTYEQNPICNGYYIRSQVNNILQSGSYEINQGYIIVELFVDEVIEPEKKSNFIS